MGDELKEKSDSKIVAPEIPLNQTPAIENVIKKRGRPFVKGQIANPAGRPKGALSMTTLLKEAIIKIAKDKDGKDFPNKDSYAHLLVKKVLQKALNGDAKSIDLIWAYIDGRPAQSIHLEGQMDMRVTTLTEEQLKKIIRDGK